MGFPGGSESKESACNARDPSSNPGLERSPEEGNGNPLQYFCLENPMDGGAWQATVHGVAKSRTRLKRLSSSSNAEDADLIPGSGRSPAEGNGNPLQYSCLENPDRKSTRLNSSHIL